MFREAIHKPNEIYKVNKILFTLSDVSKYYIATVYRSVA